MRVIIPAAVLTTVTAGIALAFESRTFHFPSPMADTLRVLVMTEAGITAGLLALIMWVYAKARIDPRDRLIRPLALFCFSCFLWCMYIALDMLGRTVGRGGDQQITWRTPVGFTSMGLAIVGLGKLLARVSKYLDKADPDSVLKVTVTDTGKPGPDIDLSTEHPVQPTQP